MNCPICKTYNDGWTCYECGTCLICFPWECTCDIDYDENIEEEEEEEENGQ